MTKPKRLSDEKIRNAMSKAMEEAQDYGNDGKPIPERQVAQVALDDCYKEMLGQFKEWGYSSCPHEPSNLQARKAFCPECWQALQLGEAL